MVCTANSDSEMKKVHDFLLTEPQCPVMHFRDVSVLGHLHLLKGEGREGK